jgi:hypothetical protein
VGYERAINQKNKCIQGGVRDCHDWLLIFFRLFKNLRPYEEVTVLIGSFLGLGVLVSWRSERLVSPFSFSEQRLLLFRCRAQTHSISDQGGDINENGFCYLAGRMSGFTFGEAITELRYEIID